MPRKRRTFPADLKAKIAVEALPEEMTLAELAATNEFIRYPTSSMIYPWMEESFLMRPGKKFVFGRFSESRPEKARKMWLLPSDFIDRASMNGWRDIEKAASRPCGSRPFLAGSLLFPGRPGSIEESGSEKAPLIAKAAGKNSRIL